MRAAWGLLVLVAALVAGSEATSLEDTARSLIEDFRAMMPVGQPEIGIPVLDPYTLKELKLSIKMSPFNANAVATNIVVPGVSGFKFTEISQIEGTNKLSVAVEVPDIEVTGDYDMKGKVKVSFVSVKLNGKGPLRIVIKGVNAKATVDVQDNGDGSYNVNDLTVDSWSYSKVDVKLDNLINGALSGAVNGLINKLVPKVVESNRNMINNLVHTQGKEVINKYLDGVAGKTKSLVAMFRAGLPQTRVTLDESTMVVTDEAQLILNRIALLIATSKLAA